MSDFRHILNGVQVSDPDGWNEFTEEVVRDDEKRLIYTQYPVTLTFVADGWRTLRDAYEEGYCNDVDYRLEQSCGTGWSVVMRGKIILADIVWDHVKCAAEAPVVDVGAGAKILNNLKISFFPTATRSKGGGEVTEVSETVLDLFDSVGDPIYTGRKTFDIYAVYQACVRFISDSTVEAESDWYNALPDNERYAVTTGQAIRISDTFDVIAPEVTFEGLHEFLCRSYNLWGAVTTNNDGTATLRLEPESYFHSGNAAASFTDLGQLTEEVDGDQLYDKVDLGSNEAVRNENDEEADCLLPYVGLNTFSEESYFVQGVCNTDESLDLVLPYVVCTNAITQALAGDTSNDKKVFVIQYDQSTGEATVGNYYSPSIAMYNGALLNSQVIQRYSLPLDLGTYVAPEEASFEAQGTTGIPTIGNLIGLTPQGSTFYATPALDFDNDTVPPGFDPNNLWDTGTQRYTAPATGWYGFELFAPWGIESVTGTAAFRLHFDVQRYDSGATPIGPPLTVSSPYIAAGNSTLLGTVQTGMNATDYIEVSGRAEILRLTPFPASGFIRIYEGYTIQLAFASTQGGVLPPADPDGARIYLWKGEWPLDLEKWQQIVGDPTIGINIGTEKVPARLTYPKRMDRNLATGLVTFDVLGNKRGD